MKLGGWLFDNLGLKLFALLLAVLLYLHVLTDRTTEEPLQLPLTVADLADTLALAAAPPESVTVRLRGTGKEILRLRYLRPPVQVSLASVGAGTYHRTLEAADVPLVGANGVTVVDVVMPDVLALEIAPRLEREVPVVATLAGEPVRGFVAGVPVVRPRVVHLSGPATWVAAQESLLTLPIAVTAKRESLHVFTGLAGVPRWATVTPGSVIVAVPIEVAEARTIEVPIEVRGVRAELRAELSPRAGTVTWRGSRSEAAALARDAYGASVDAGRKGRGEWVLPVTWSGPGLGGAATASPESVKVVLH